MKFRTGLRSTVIVMIGVFYASIVLAQTEWTPVSEAPIVAYGERGTWNGVYIEPGAALYHDGQYHLFITGYPGFPAKSGIGYLTSDDGITYTWMSPDPVLTTDDVPYAAVAIGASSVLVEDDGTWVLYFYNMNARGWPRIQATISRATADNPLGPWTPDPEPILTAGEAERWDSAGVAYPTVIRMDDGYRMYFTGQDAIGREAIGLATSADGITWEKHPDPIFGQDDRLIRSFVVAEVVYTGDTWLMAYKDSRTSVSLAASDDGLTWTPLGDEPILTALDLDGISSIGYISLIADDAHYTLYYEGHVGSRAQVYAATAPLSLAD